MLKQMLTSLTVLVVTIQLVRSASYEESPQRNITTTNVTSTVSSLFSYAGTDLPSDWTLLSVLNDRAIIAFKNGTSRNSLISELSTEDQRQVNKLQGKAFMSTPLAKTKEKLSEWANSATTAVTKFSKGVAESMSNLFKQEQQINKP